MALEFSRVLEHIKQNMAQQYLDFKIIQIDLFEAASKLSIEIPYSRDELNEVQKEYIYK